jgi:hypothetical protein
MTIDETASFMGISRRQVQYMIGTGELQRVGRGGLGLGLRQVLCSYPWRRIGARSAFQGAMKQRWRGSASKAPVTSSVVV